MADEPVEPTAKSILDTAKKMLGIPSTDTSFDADIISNINSAFMTLNQLGIGPETPYLIKSNEEVWGDFMSHDLEMFGGLEMYMYLKTKLGFDPPTTSFTIDAIKQQIEELEQRFSMQVLIMTFRPT